MVNVRVILAIPVAGAVALSLLFDISDLSDAKAAVEKLSAERAEWAARREAEEQAKAKAQARQAFLQTESRSSPEMPLQPAPETPPETGAAIAPTALQPAKEQAGSDNQMARLDGTEPAPDESASGSPLQASTATPQTSQPETKEQAITGPASMKKVRKAIRARDFAGAARMLETLGDDPEARYMLATLYRKGDGVPRDDARAFSLMSEAAEAGHLEAEFSLARMYLSGRGVKADPAQAQLWLARAAESGHVGATEALVTLMTQAIPLPVEDVAPEPEAPRVVASDIGGRLGKTPLIEAAERGEMRTLRRLFEAGAVADTRDATGRTPLMLAAAGGHKDAVHFLIDQGAVQSATDADGRTALMHAAGNGHKAIVALLAADEATRLLGDNDGHTASDLAFLDGHCATGTAVFSGTVAPDVEPNLLKSCTADDLATLAGLGVRFRQDDGRGRSPVWYAAQAGNRDAVAFLIEAGYPVDNEALSPLLVAINGAHADIATLLIENGADIRAETRSGNTALLIAVTRGLGDIAGQLVERGADIDHRNADGYSGLMLAAKFGREDIARLLIGLGADPSLRNAKREQAFDIAEAAGFAEIAALLD